MNNMMAKMSGIICEHGLDCNIWVEYDGMELV